MRERVQVVVSPNEVESYIARGYARSDIGAELLLGANVWGLLSHEEREGLVVVEADKEKHTGLNSHRRQHGVLLLTEQLVVSALARELHVLEVDGAHTLCANALEDKGPEVWRSGELFDSPTEAVEASAQVINDAIEQHEAAALRLRKFLGEQR